MANGLRLKGVWVSVPYVDDDGEIGKGFGRIQELICHIHIDDVQRFFIKLDWFDYTREDGKTHFPIWNEKKIDPKTRERYRNVLPVDSINQLLTVTPLPNGKEFLFNPNFNW